MAENAVNAAELVGSPTADELTTTHLGLVAHVVRETARNLPAHVSRDDLHSAGLTALVKAARAFDAERGVPFARYAITRIRGALVDELRGVDWASRSVRRRSRDIEAARTELATALGRVPDTTEVARSLGMTVAEVVSAEGDVARAQVLSLQGDGERDFEDVLVSPAPTPEAQVLRQERLSYLVDAIAVLPERLRVVVEDYFLVERPMAEIAEQLGVSESRVSQMRAEALVLLRDAMNQALDPELVPPPTGRADGCAARRRQSYFRAVAERHDASVRGRRLPPPGLTARIDGL